MTIQKSMQINRFALCHSLLFTRFVRLTPTDRTIELSNHPTTHSTHFTHCTTPTTHPPTLQRQRDKRTKAETVVLFLCTFFAFNVELFDHFDLSKWVAQWGHLWFYPKCHHHLFHSLSFVAPALFLFTTLVRSNLKAYRCLFDI